MFAFVVSEDIAAELLWWLSNIHSTSVVLRMAYRVVGVNNGMAAVVGILVMLRKYNVNLLSNEFHFTFYNLLNVSVWKHVLAKTMYL